MRLILTTLLLFALITAKAQAPVFTFKCFSNASMTGDSCDICPGTTFTSRSFSGLMVYRLGDFYKWIDEPYIIRLRPGASVEFIEQAVQNPDKITVSLAQTGFSTINGFIDSTFCAGANIDFSFFASDSIRTKQIGNLDTVKIVGRGGTSVEFDTVALKYVITSPTATGGTNLSYSSTSSPVTLNSSTGTDVTISGGTGIGLSATGTALTITNTGDVNPSDDITGSGTINYMPKFTSSQVVGNSQLFDNGTNVGIGLAAPLQKLDINGAISLRYATANPDTVNGWLTLGGLNRLASSSGGSAIGPLSTFNSIINRPIRTLVIQGASDGLGEGISFVTGSGKTERLNIGRSGTYLFNNLNGTGNRFPVLDASGFLTRGTVDPSALILGNGAANQVTYYTGAQTITSSANLVFNGTNVGIGGVATPEQRLDVNGGINMRYVGGMNPNTTNAWLYTGAIETLMSGKGGSLIGNLSTYNATIDRPVRTLVIQSASDGNDAGMSFVTGGTPTERIHINRDGDTFFKKLTGSGDRLAKIESTGKVSATTIDPATIPTGNIYTTNGTLLADRTITSGNNSLTIDASTATSPTGYPLILKGKADGTNITQAITFQDALGSPKGYITVANNLFSMLTGSGVNYLIGSGSGGWVFNQNGFIKPYTVSTDPTVSGQQGALWFNTTNQQWKYNRTIGSLVRTVANIEDDIQGSTNTYTLNFTITGSQFGPVANAASGNITVTVDANVKEGYTYFLRAENNAANTVTIVPASGYTINVDGVSGNPASYQLTAYEVVRVNRYGTNITIDK